MEVNEQASVTEMTPEEKQQRLSKCEQDIESGSNSFLRTGRALRDIQKDHLYESAGYPTFEDYCEARWQFSRITGYSYANAYNTYETVKTVLTDTKLSFSHYAALSRLYDKHEETQKALKEFVEKHKDELKGITVRDLGKMVKAAEESEEGESGGNTMSEAARITARIKREAKKLPELIAEANPDANAKKKLAGALKELAKQYKAEADKLLGKYKEKAAKEEAAA